MPDDLFLVAGNEEEKTFLRSEPEADFQLSSQLLTFILIFITNSETNHFSHENNVPHCNSRSRIADCAK